uniref:phosphogluconate dehydrogenase (NADP(+)-dependent, decarboxylating) n=1 Tax=Papio anubis TaxID=9555 RepID=A0A8I5R2F6_PAPAN
MISSKNWYHCWTLVTSSLMEEILNIGTPQPHIKTICQGIAAKVGTGEPCCDWVGDEAAGHFVKMVHNGIEYGDVLLICEAYHLMKDVLGMAQDTMAQVFEDWNKTELDSFLIEITANILKFQDADGKRLLPKIRDSAGQKGMGKWTTISALEYGVPVTLTGEAVFARCLSPLKNEIIQASKKLKGPQKFQFDGDKKSFLEDIWKVPLHFQDHLLCSSLYAAKAAPPTLAGPSIMVASPRCGEGATTSKMYS